MAHALCTDTLQYKFFNGTWSSWSSNLYGGYAGRSNKYLVVLKFKTDSLSGLYTDTKLNFIVPFIRSSDNSNEFNVYFKLYDTDPTPATGSATKITYPSSWDHTAYITTKSLDPVDVDFSLTKSITANKTYYLLIGSSQSALEIGYKYDNTDDRYSVIYEYTPYTLGAAPTISCTDNGNNTATLSVNFAKEATNNTLTEATLYYTTNGNQPDGTTEGLKFTKKITWSGPIAGESTKREANIPITSAQKIIAVVYCDFKYGTDPNTGHKPFNVLYHTNGGSPSITNITDNGNNTFTITGNVGANGTNNTRSSTILYYTTNGEDPSSSDSTRTGVAESYLTIDSTTKDFSYTANIPSKATNGETTIKAHIVSTFPWGSTDANKTKTASKINGSVTYHTALSSSPAVGINDNGNNTFTISGVNATYGINNTATTTYTWGYDGSCTGGGSTTVVNNGGNTAVVNNQRLNLSTTNGKYSRTRKVSAKAVATPSWTNDTGTYQDYAELYVAQYVAPNDPGTPVVSYTRSRPTLKEPWTYTWSAPSDAGGCTSLSGYRIRLYKNNENVPIVGSSGTRLSTTTTGSGTSRDYIYDTDSTSTSIDIYPDKQNFAVGDAIKLRIFAYSKNGKGEKLFSGGGTAAAESAVTTVQNAGIVNVKIDGKWKEGQVYIKINNTWQEAESVYVKVSDKWCEST